MIEGPLEFPGAKDDDDDDVAWALSTALVQWKRGSRADAVVWLRRAVDSAVSVGATWRAAELTRQTDALEEALLRRAEAPSASAVEVDDFDGVDIIDEDDTSVPPAATRTAPSFEPLHGDATDEHTDVTAELVPEDEEEATEIEPEPDDDDDDAPEIEDVEILEIEEDDISEDDLGDVDDGQASPRFASEAPTADIPNPGFKLPYEIEPEDEVVPSTVSEPAPETRSEPPPPSERPPVLVAAPVSVRAPSSLPPEARSALPSEMDLKSTPDAQPEPELPPPSIQTEPFVAGVSLAEIKGFEDFPPETQLELANVARVERLATDEEVAGFGLALVLRGAVNVMPAVADVACGSAGERELVYGRGTLPDGVALRLVATAPDTQVAIWEFATIEPPLAECPWVLEELRGVADRYQALAGVSMGPMGERLDDSLRAMVLSRCRLVKLLPDELLVEKGKPVGGLYIVGAGRLKLGNSESELGPGDFLFAQQILGGGAAPTTARAGAAGALLMVAERHAAHELMLSVPPLLELLAG
jgi:hypothetical protein